MKIAIEILKLLPTLVPVLLGLFRRRPKPESVPVPEPVISPEPAPEPLPEPLPPVKRPTDYIPWQDRETWALRVDSSYSVWRGERDLAFLLSYPEVVKDLGFNEPKLRENVKYMERENEKRLNLIYRIRNDKHSEFADRSQVRKSVAEEMIGHMFTVTAIYTDYQERAEELDVVWGLQFDSFQGFIVDNPDPQYNTERYNAWKARREE